MTFLHVTIFIILMSAKLLLEYMVTSSWTSVVMYTILQRCTLF